MAKIAIVGAGRIGSGLARLWSRASYDVTISFSRDTERLAATAGDFGFSPKGVPHAFLVRLDRAEYLTKRRL
jgi:predicted dinucleotide-binding enzyme